MLHILTVAFVVLAVVFVGDWVIRRLRSRQYDSCEINPPLVDVEGISRATDQLLRQIGGRA